jgi:O-antigen/teichoic acid export membrane protein
MIAGRFYSRLHAWLGPLGGSTLLVFTIWRVGDVATMVTKLLLGRWLPPDAFGAVEPFAAALALIAMPILVVNQIGVKSISRLAELGRHDANTALLRDLAKFAAAGSVLSALAIYALRGLIFSRLHLPVEPYLPLMIGLTVLAWWAPLTGAVIQGMQRYGLSAIGVICAPLLVLGLTALLTGRMGLGLAGNLLARVAGSMIPLLVVLFLLRAMFRGRRASYRDEGRAMWRMALPMAVFLGSWTLLFQFDRLYVRNFMLADSGGFGAVLTLGQIPLWLIGPVTFVLFPLAAAEHAGGRDARRFLAQATAACLIATTACVIGARLFAEPLIRLWQPVYVPYARYVWVYALGMGLHGLIEVVGRFEMARHRYGFLWFLAVPTVAVCVWMRNQGSSLTLAQVIWILTAVRVVILAGMALVSGRK